MLTLLLSALLSVPAQAEELFLHVDRVDPAGERAVLSVPWRQVDRGDLAEAIGPMVQALRPELDSAALEMMDSQVGQSTILRHRDAGTRLVVRLEQRPDPSALFDDLLVDVAATLAECAVADRD